MGRVAKEYSAITPQTRILLKMNQMLNGTCT